MKYCTGCGTTLTDDVVFCTVCGKRCSEEALPSRSALQAGFNRAGTLDLESTPSQPKPPVYQEQPPVYQEQPPVYQGQPPVYQGQPPVYQGQPPVYQGQPPVYQEQPPIQQNPMKPAKNPVQKIKKQKKTPALQKKPMSKGRRIFLCVVAAVLAVAVAAGVLFLRWYNSPEQKTIRAVEASNYEEAATILEENPQAREENALVEQIRSQIAAIKAAYGDGATPYDVAVKELGAIQTLHVSALNEEIGRVREYIERVEDSRMEFAKAEEAFNSGDYATAWYCYDAVIEEDTNYEAACRKKTETENLYREETLETAKSYAEEKEYASAIRILNEALKILPGDAMILARIETLEEESGAYKKSSTLSMAEDFAKQGQYLKAYEAVKNIRTQMPDDADVAAAVQKYQGLYEEQVVAEADALEAERKYDEAISLLRTAQQKCSGSTVISSKLNEISARKPVSITGLTAINSEKWGKWNDGTPKDPFGNNYTDKNNFVIIKGAWEPRTYSTEYCVDEKYDFLFFTISPYAEYHKDNYSYVQVFVDDVLRYTSPKITQKTQPYTIPSLDISDAKYIRIVVHTGADCSVLLTDVFLQKNDEYVSDLNQNYTSANLLEFFNGEFPWNNQYPEDVHGNDYTNAQNYCYFTSGWNVKEYYAEYYLAKNYTGLSFGVAPVAEMQEGRKVVIKIYVDDKLVYTSEDITQKTMFFTVDNIDLSDANYLKIVIDMSGDSGIILSNLLLKNA